MDRGPTIPPAGAGTAHGALRRVVRMVRRRWRLKLVLRGLAITGAGTIAAVLAATYGMDQLRFATAAVTAFRVAAYAVPLALLARFLVIPLLRRAPDERVALYLEEHEPLLAGQVLAAVDAIGAGGTGRGGAETSSALLERLVERAVEACARIDEGRRVDRSALARSATAAAGATMAGIAVLALGPAFLRHGAPFLFSPLTGAESRSPYAIEVMPGDTLVPRGADLKVRARLHNFQAERVEIVWRRDGAAEREREVMVLDEEAGEYAILLFAVDAATEYAVEAQRVRSPVFRIAVGELPYVARIDLEYHFPAYTGLAPRRDEDGGDIAALPGTRVVLTVTPTVPVAGGGIVLDGGEPLGLQPAAAGTLTGELIVERRGSYRIALRAAGGLLVDASPTYVIDLLADQPPSVTFVKPGRDLTVTSIDEVFAEVTAEDDYGVGRVELVYAVNGGPERSLQLHAGGRPLRQVTATHTFYLEELDLQPGDLVAYYARGEEARRGAGARTAATDIYFIRIRPFDRTFRQADEALGGQGGGPQGQLSRRQREIIAATFRVVRDSALYPEKEYNENLATLALAQGRLREEVKRLADQMVTRRIVELDSTFRAVAEALPRSVTAMAEAEARLGRRAPREALPHEQRALQHLQRAEAAFRERQIARADSRSAGDADVDVEELADLFQLEMDRMRNQYEGLDRGRREQTDQAMDEVMERLRELARRQQQQAERLRAQAQRGDPTGGTRSTQRRLAEETEELARRLERLSREESRPGLEETARRLREASEAMRRAAADPSGAAEGASALDRLRDATRLLERTRSAGLRRDVEDALERARRLAQEQQAVAEEVARLPASPRDRQGAVRRLDPRKERMAGEVADLEADLDHLTRRAREEQPEAARKLEEAANAIRRDRIEDKIRFSREAMREQSGEYARNFEEAIASELEHVRDRIAEAAGAIGETREQRVARALDRMRDLANSLESMGERLRQGEQPPSAHERAAREGGEERMSQARAGEGRTEESQRDQADQGDARRGAPGRRGVVDPRQLRREISERRQEMARLREELSREGFDASRLQELASRLGRMDNPNALGTPQGIAELQGEIVRGLRELEFRIRRQLAGAPDRFLRAASGDVPPEFRELVEEYFKALAEERRRQP